MPAAIPIIATVAAEMMTKKPSLGSYRDTAERKQVLRAAASPKTVVYGRTVSAGTLFFAEEQPGEQTDGEWVHLAITLAGHPISGTGTIYLGDDDIGSYGESATYEVHIDRQTADPFMLANCPSWDQFQEAANICDELVTNGDGTTEKRYTLNGEFDLSENKASILEAMLTAGAAEPTYIAGKHGILVGAYYGPATEVITESQLAGDIEIMPEVSQSERVNTISGTFVDPKQTLVSRSIVLILPSSLLVGWRSLRI
nr:hypothetical protein [Enterobacter cloacae]